MDAVGVVYELRLFVGRLELQRRVFAALDVGARSLVRDALCLVPLQRLPRRYVYDASAVFRVVASAFLRARRALPVNAVRPAHVWRLLCILARGDRAVVVVRRAEGRPRRQTALELVVVEDLPARKLRHDLLLLLDFGRRENALLLLRVPLLEALPQSPSEALGHVLRDHQLAVRPPKANPPPSRAAPLLHPPVGLLER